MTFKEKLQSKKFIITAELLPPKGIDISILLKKINHLEYIDAVNVTDNQRASMRASSIAISKILIDNGVDPILQIVTRDKNRIALQSDLLGASILGIENLLLLSGDHTSISEYYSAKAVYDLDTIQLIKTARLLETGIDLVGNNLSGAPKFCVGAVINPSSTPQGLQVLMYKKKVLAGAEFFQTQAIFDIELYKKFFKQVQHLKVKILPGLILIKSIRFMNFLKSLPGVKIPQCIQDRIENAKDPLEEGKQICSQLIKELRNYADGVHIMAIGIEEHIPDIIKHSF
ncbi:MAG: methylenetetrahydrofolate reductase [Endomicrobium sp.]|jgi:5,10-methylenetetrahydrofolate reductase|nr:methylenetetrahydrofolate reductase [Endomicrobium sp.]